MARQTKNPAARRGSSRLHSGQDWQKHSSAMGQLYGGRSRGFIRDRLPDPNTYYRERIEGLSRGNSEGWAEGRCPLHDDRHASLSVNVITGGFRCHACGLAGDLLRFHMLRTGLDFKEAARDLGAWK